MSEVNQEDSKNKALRVQSSSHLHPERVEDEHAIVIGAGIAGLSAAQALQKSGWKVTVLEASGRVGGRMTTDRVNGWIIDRGAQYLSDTYVHIPFLLKETDLEEELKEIPKPGMAIVRAGRPRRLHQDEPLSALFSGLLSPVAWLRFGSHVLKLQWESRGVGPEDFYSYCHRADDSNAAEWYGKNLGTEIAQYIIEPILAGTFFQSSGKMSKAIPQMMLAFSGKKKRGAMKTLLNGLGSLPEELARRLDVRLNTAAQAILANEDRIGVQTSQGTLQADRVVLATTASAARALYPQADALEKKLMAVNYSSTIHVAYATRRDWRYDKTLGNIYGLLIPEKERKVLASIAIESGIAPQRMPEGELLHFYLSEQSAGELLEKPEGEILNLVLQEAERYFPEICKEKGPHHVIRWKEALPLFPVGRVGLLMEYRRQAPGRKVLLAGDYMGIPSVDGAAETGLWAADQILQ